MQRLYWDRQDPGDYHQVVLLDAEHPELRQWQTGEEAALGGPHGVTVATGQLMEDELVEIAIYAGPGTPPGILCPEQDMSIGSDGLVVGDPEYDYAKLSWPSGQAHVSAYVNSLTPYPHLDVKVVTFVLESSATRRPSQERVRAMYP